MQKYRLIIQRHGQLLGHFDSDVPWAREAVRTIVECLGAQGYDLELRVAEGERRLLESTPEGIRLLGSEPLFRPASLEAL
ncbi:cytoplasmic protein [Pseudomonas sp. ZM23]|uniref:Cytoplasmic protein n=1 Tax=Pseudomonas triclosanedens TaxID=2961893 RepID=A0ABY6ZS23_9PSED|nr:cytoplasmic protein [Pseudomonas triclosanedens]MCP8467056.1 cytoplasmic protein [Pseudomonas triclosanedens]MCP8472796.1 cytoplasmic protein [Pseudomonas triclosanedens]MCP8478227.1 cytoplasmic protein [Pseudomonas triclosanedens]WAI47633.1 cytoplasmic protein [Pseudomonas triclosanedens]